jgi:hypothetical protein
MAETPCPPERESDDLPVFSADNFLDESTPERREGSLVFAHEGVLFLANQPIDYRLPNLRIFLCLALLLCSALAFAMGLAGKMPWMGALAAVVFVATAALGLLLLRSERRRLREVQPPPASIEDVVTTWPGCWRVAPGEIASLRVELAGHAQREVHVTVTSTDGRRRTLVAPHSLMAPPKQLLDQIRHAAQARGWPTVEDRSL